MEPSIVHNDDLIKVHDENNESWRFIKRDKGLNKQLSTIEGTLSSFGLLKNEIRVYLHLARVGEKKAGEIAEATSLHRTETYRILRDLERKSLVFSAFEKPLKFTAVPLEKAMDLLIDAQKMKIRLLEREKASVAKLWLSMPQPAVPDSRKEIFQILEGGQQITLKANELLGKAKREIQIFAPQDYLAQLYRSDFTDNLEQVSDKIDVSLLTENSTKSKFFLEQMRCRNHQYRMVDVKNLPCFIISDRKELLIAIQRDSGEQAGARRSKSKTVALWTNYDALVATLEILFSKLSEMGKTFQEIREKRLAHPPQMC